LIFLVGICVLKDIERYFNHRMNVATLMFVVGIYLQEGMERTINQGVRGEDYWLHDELYRWVLFGTDEGWVHEPERDMGTVQLF